MTNPTDVAAALGESPVALGGTTGDLLQAPAGAGGGGTMTLEERLNHAQVINRQMTDLAVELATLLPLVARDAISRLLEIGVTRDMLVDVLDGADGVAVLEPADGVAAPEPADDQS